LLELLALKGLEAGLLVEQVESTWRLIKGLSLKAMVLIEDA